MKLAELVSLYITSKQSAGMRFRSEAGILNAFCRSLREIDVVDVQPSAVMDFIAGSGPITAYWHFKFTVLRGLYRFAMARGYADVSPLPTTMPRRPQGLTPYVYSSEELRRLLTATGRLRAPNSPLQATTFRSLLLVLYGTAIRVGEALSLTMADVNLPESLITVRDAKFFKSRLVPIGPKLTDQLSAYKKQRCLLPLPQAEASAFFATRTGNALTYHRVRQLFVRLRKIANIRREDGARYQPRLHDLRHTAATHRVVTWYREGANLQRLLPRLSTYLGHVDIASTQRYLSMTTELLRQASRRFERYARTGVHDE